MIQKILKSIFLTALLLFFVQSCSTKKPVKKSTTQKPTIVNKPKPKPPIDNQDSTPVKLPEINREFRAAWIATVANINWPTKNTLSSDQQKAEAIQILDLLKSLNFNAVVFQARPSADALYKSDLEPWSYFLTGKIGESPYPYYDPLEFWISEAHKRGMELHVWLNPYRAHHSNGGSITSESMVKKMPEQIVKLRNGMYWMDPSDEKTQNHVSAVIKDLVKRYDMDAIHIDDYFYPYREYNGGKDFPDDKTWKQFQNSGGTLSKADWRRANVNKFIKRIHDEIKAEKSYVKFGISPFGIWKNKIPEDITGTSQYDELYADAKLWLNQGWCDYFSPQLYWREEGPQRFSSLLKWWEQENYKNIHLWPGINTIGVKDVNKVDEINKQINITRNLLKNEAGEIHYSVDGISKNWEMQTMLKDLYKNKALTPASPWLKIEKLGKPSLAVKNMGNNIQANWSSENPKSVFYWVLFTKYGENWDYEIIEKEELSKTINATKSGKKLGAIAVKSIDRLGNESEYILQKIK